MEIQDLIKTIKTVNYQTDRPKNSRKRTDKNTPKLIFIMTLTTTGLTVIEQEIADLGLGSFVDKIEQLILDCSNDELERYKKEISWSNQFKVNFSVHLNDSVEGSLSTDSLGTAQEYMDGSSYDLPSYAEDFDDVEMSYLEYDSDPNEIKVVFTSFTLINPSESAKGLFKKEHFCSDDHQTIFLIPNCMTPIEKELDNNLESLLDHIRFLIRTKSPLLERYEKEIAIEYHCKCDFDFKLNVKKGWLIADDVDTAKDLIKDAVYSNDINRFENLTDEFVVDINSIDNDFDIEFITFELKNPSEDAIRKFKDISFWENFTSVYLINEETRKSLKD